MAGGRAPRDRLLAADLGDDVVVGIDALEGVLAAHTIVVADDADITGERPVMGAGDDDALLGGDRVDGGGDAQDLAVHRGALVEGGLEAGADGLDAAVTDLRGQLGDVADELAADSVAGDVREGGRRDVALLVLTEVVELGVEEVLRPFGGLRDRGVVVDVGDIVYSGSYTPLRARLQGAVSKLPKSRQNRYGFRDVRQIAPSRIAARNRS